MPPKRPKRRNWAKTILLSRTFITSLASDIGRIQLPLYAKSRQRSTRVTGREYIDGLLEAGDGRCRDVLGLSVSNFYALETWLRVHGGATDPDISRGGQVLVDEQLAFFLWITRHGSTFSMAGEHFQRSKDTIKHYFGKITNSLVLLFKVNVVLPDTNSPTPHDIRTNPKLYPFFKDCVGAGDGTHIKAKVPTPMVKRFRNRKGEISQNVFATCDFDFRFTYVLPGWEGSAHDGKVLDDALSKGFSVPYGRFYLMDAGYGLRPGFLTPYRGVRYHLKEQKQANARPENKEELYNLRHAKARNIIERIFGVLKKRFKILRLPLEYKISLQVKLVRAITAVYNFIRETNEITRSEIEGYQLSAAEETERRQNLNNGRGGGEATVADDAGMKAFRDRLATEMWESYQAYHSM